MPDGSYSPVASGYAARFNAANFYFWNPREQHINKTNGGSPSSMNGQVDFAVSFPSFWQMESMANVITNDWLITRSEQSARKIVDQWAYIRSVPQFTPVVLAGNSANVISNASDDACWHAQFLVHVHQVTGDPVALAYLAEVIPATTLRWLDPNSSATQNPVITNNGARSPNLPNIAYGTTPNNLPFVYNTYGMLYSEVTSPGYAQFGAISTSYEAFLALCALYVYEQLNYDPYLAYAKNTFAWIKGKLRTPSPNGNAGAKAEGIYETELVLNPSGGTPRDTTAAYRTPVHAFYGKPVRNVDSTFLGGALAMAVLGARLGRNSMNSATERAAYTAEAVSIANTIISTQAYGRTNVVSGQTLIANTRDPWTEAHVAVPFAQEVLTLPGVSAASSNAFLDTATYILNTQVAAGNRLTADWAGPESFMGGNATWEADFNANPGTQAAPQQIMTTCETLAMIQAGLVVDRRNRSVPYREDLHRA